MRVPLNVVLLEPEIPANTGNIGRTCVATGTVLHLIRPLGFSTEDKYLRRSGMDYWRELDVRYYDNVEDFLSCNGLAAERDPRLILTSSKVTRSYTQVDYPPGCFILFGKESAGLPETLLARFPETAVRIPMLDGVRCINLGSSVAVVLYEALRGQGFEGMA